MLFKSFCLYKPVIGSPLVSDFDVFYRLAMPRVQYKLLFKCGLLYKKNQLKIKPPFKNLFQDTEEVLSILSA